MHFLVNTAKEVVQKELVKQLYKEDLFDFLLQETDGIADRRAQCQDSLKVLENAVKIMDQIRDHDLKENLNNRSPTKHNESLDLSIISN